MQGPRITLSKRKTVPATTYNSKVASSYIKKKKNEQKQVKFVLTVYIM